VQAARQTIKNERRVRRLSRRNLQSRPVANGLRRRRNNAPGRTNVVDLNRDRRVVGDVPLLNAVLMQFEEGPSRNGARQLAGVEDVETGAHAAMPSRAKHITRKVRQNVRRLPVIGPRHHGPVEWAARIQNSKAHWSAIDQFGQLPDFDCSSDAQLSRRNRNRRHIRKREGLSKEIEREFRATTSFHQEHAAAIPTGRPQA